MRARSLDAAYQARLFAFANRLHHSIPPIEAYIEETLREAGLENPSDIQPMEALPSDR